MRLRVSTHGKLNRIVLESDDAAQLFFACRSG